jgi:hypothetical protein
MHVRHMIKLPALRRYRYELLFEPNNRLQSNLLDASIRNQQDQRASVATG